jgi:predicted ABC-type ATPase
MEKPEFILVAGCNAAGKSTFIRTRLSRLVSFEVIMTDVYRNRTKEVFRQSVKNKKNIIIETVFNDVSFKDLVDEAKNAGYHTSLIVLFLDSIQKSAERVAFRGEQESGIVISGSNIRLNFEQSFKNIASYYFYFDTSDFIYTGLDNKNDLIMSFERDRLVSYKASDLNYPQSFARYSYGKERLNKEAYLAIVANQNL